MKIREKRKRDRTTVICKMESEDNFDSFEADQYASCPSPWFAPFSYELRRKKAVITYDLTGCVKLAAFLRTPMSREAFFTLIDGFIEFLYACEEDWSYLHNGVFSYTHVYVDTHTRQPRFLYLPTGDEHVSIHELSEVLANVGSNAVFENPDADESLARIYNRFFEKSDTVSLVDYSRFASGFIGKPGRGIVEERVAHPVQGAVNRAATYDPWSSVGHVPPVGATDELTRQSSSATTARLMRRKTGEAVPVVLREGAFKIGSVADSDYAIIDNGAISHRHLVIYPDGDGFYLMDLGSTNGTWMNDMRLAPNTPVRLLDGQRFNIADEEFEFHL